MDNETNIVTLSKIVKPAPKIVPVKPIVVPGGTKKGQSIVKTKDTNDEKKTRRKRGDGEDLEILYHIAKSTSKFYQSRDGKTWAIFEKKQIRQTEEISSQKYKYFLIAKYYEKEEISVATESVKNIIQLLQAQAQSAGICVVDNRIGQGPDGIYLDLADGAGNMVEIDKLGWRIVNKSPILFRRSSTIRDLPMPEKGGTIDDLRALVNVNEDDFILLIGYLLGCLSPSIPYPLLIVGGEHGSAKSTLVKLIKTLIDPVAGNIRSLPADEKDLMISAQNQHILAFDNVSKLEPEMSDALCRLATGGGLSTRMLYTNSEELVLECRRPVILNGIRDVATRPDLVDRSILVRTIAIPAENRRTESEIEHQINQAKPKILGWLLDLVARGLSRIDQVQLASLPRMADFAKWVSACGDGEAWPDGEFLSVYNANRASAVEGLATDDTLVQLIRKLMVRTTRPKGSNTPGSKVYLNNKSEFLSDVKGEAGDDAKKMGFLSSSRALSGAIRESIPLLRSVGIDVDLDYRTASGRQTKIQMIESQEDPPF